MQAPHGNGTQNDGRGRSGPWESLEAALSAAARALRALWREGSRRQLALRDRAGRTLVRLPLTIAVLIGLFLLWRAALLLILGVVLVLALRGSFVILERPAPQA